MKNKGPHTRLVDPYVGERSNAYSQLALNLSDFGGVFPHLAAVALYFGDPVALPCFS